MKNSKIVKFLGNRAWALLAICAPGLSSLAIDPVPDWKTLIFPTMVPKAGNTAAGTTAINFSSGTIREDYEQIYEKYWKETSYYDYDQTSGANIRGYFNDTKTYGYTAIPWPIKPRDESAVGGGSLAGENFRDDRQRNYMSYNDTRINDRWGNQRYFADACLNDGAWTPGESFFDTNANGKWDPRVPHEDYWNSDSWTATNANDFFLQSRTTNGIKTGIPLTFSVNGIFSVNDGAGINLNNYNNTSANGAFWRPDAGEVFVDWNDNYATEIAANRSGYNSVVNNFRYFDGAVQVGITVNEMDFFPTDPAHGLAGDMAHTVVVDPELGGVAPTSIPVNGTFNFTVDANLTPQVFATGDYVEYEALVVSNAAAIARGYYRFSERWNAAGPQPTGSNNVVGLGTIRAFVYGTRELYGVDRGPRGVGGNAHGDQGGNPLPIRIVTQDNTWTDQTPGEKFEDFISFRNAAGQMIFLSGNTFSGVTNVGTNYGQIGVGGNNSIGRDRPATIAWPAYEAYLRWNYPGSGAGITALLSRAYNGRYDGPEDWTESFNKKFLPGNTTIAVVPPGFDFPLAPPHWGDIYTPGLFPTWEEWFTATFSSNNVGAGLPVFPGTTRVANDYDAVNSTGGAEWKPVTTWAYDSPAEICDLPSSIYHLGGDALNGITILGSPWRWVSYVNSSGSTVPMFDNGTNMICRMYGGDFAFGEMLSPWNDNVNGHDLWSIIPSGPSGPDSSVPSGGPFALNTIAVNGFDGADMTAIELVTRRIDLDPANPNSVHPAQFRDTNLDGIWDRGNYRTGDPHYSTGDGGSGAYPFNRERFMEDVIATWDQHEDFNLLGVPAFGMPWDTRLYGFPIYQNETNVGWKALGGPAGANRQILTRDNPIPLGVVFQVRPMAGGLEEGGSGTVSNSARSDFGMAILCHEQGHDIQGWPDLYDYDVWSVVGGLIVNTPIAGYDLMSGGGLVHGIADMKVAAGWTTTIDLSTILAVGGGPVTLNFYPVDRFEDQYFTYPNLSRPGEFIDLWYTANQSDYGVVGGAGIYITHQDFGAYYPFGEPIQQRVNGHFTWELLQADGLNQLQDAVNFGDAGDPWPGTSNNRTFTADGDPAARWWDQSDMGLRILDIVLPTSPAQPARVTMEMYDPTSPWPWLYSFADADNDGIPDAWELHYFADLTTANGATDYDRDGLLDITEYIAGTDPMHRYSADLAQIVDDSLYDSDADGLVNIAEQTIGTSPRLPDTDDDSISDGAEYSMGLVPTNSLSPLIDRVLSLTASPANYLQLQNGLNPSASSMPLALSTFTLEAWIHPISNNVASELITRSLNNVSGYYNYRLQLLTNRLLRLSFSRNDASGTVQLDSPSYAIIPLNQWSHVQGAFDAQTGKISLHLNGQLIAWQWTSGLPMTGDTPVSPGGPLVSSAEHIVGMNFDGMIDEVRIWNLYPGDRTIPQLQQVLTGAESGLVAYHRFEDGTNTNGVSGIGGTQGQVENYVHRADWNNGWVHAATLKGGATLTNAPIAAPVLAGNGDDDLDGLPNWWEILYGISPANANGASGPWGDIDGDGLNNLGEYLSGTDPLRFDSSGNQYGDYFTKITNGIYSGFTYGEIYDDGDKIPDTFEALYPNVLDPSRYDADQDPDGDGWDNFSEYQGSTNPDSNGSYPVPAITAIATYEGAFGSAPLRFAAYNSASMDGQPSCRGIIFNNMGSGLFQGGVTNITSGHFHQGANWLLAWKDIDDDGVYSADEPAGLIQNRPVDIQVGNAHEMVFHVRDQAPEGTLRFAWNPAGIGNTATVRVTRTTTAGSPVMFVRTNLLSRSYIHEGDFYFAGAAAMFGMDAGASFLPGYAITIYGSSSNPVVYSATFDWQSPLSAPAIVQPNGSTLNLALNDLIWTQDVNATRAYLEIRAGATNGPLILSTNLIPPVSDINGHRTTKLPLIAGDGSFTNGQYYAKIQTFNPRQTSSPSAWTTFIVNLSNSPASSYSIAGNVHYLGKLTNAVIVVQASKSMGFGGYQYSQITLKNGMRYFELSGLPPGDYFIRAFADQNGNKVLDAWESFGLYKLPNMFSVSNIPFAVTVPVSTGNRDILILPRDTDDDNLPDDWETQYFATSAVATTLTDSDGDGLTDGVEYVSGTNPMNVDTDGDGLSDGLEVNSTLTSPLKFDTDADGLSDSFEVSVAGTNPNNGDQDGDGYWDALEIVSGYSPSNNSAFPSNNFLLQITAMLPGTTSDVITYARAGGITSIYYKVGSAIEMKTSLAATVWTEIASSKRTIAPSNWLGGPWSFTNNHSPSSTSIFYNVRWSVVYP